MDSSKENITKDRQTTIDEFVEKNPSTKESTSNTPRRRGRKRKNETSASTEPPKKKTKRTTPKKGKKRVEKQKARTEEEPEEDMTTDAKSDTQEKQSDKSTDQAPEESTSEGTSYTEEDYKKMKVGEMRSELERLGLSPKGKKLELRKRLLDALGIPYVEKPRPKSTYVKKKKPPANALIHYFKDEAAIYEKLYIKIPEWKPNVVETDSVKIGSEKTLKILVSEKPIEIPAFTSVKFSDSCYFLNVGGPVWNFEWCLSNDDQEQYAATTIHPKERHIIGKKFTGNGFIDIWEMGLLSDSSKMTNPKLIMRISHEHGFIWKMKWCPRRCTENYQDTVIKHRLGILAVAFSDGTLGIYSIPHPKDLLKDENIIMVKLKGCEYSYSEDIFTTVEWSHDLRYLAAGCMNGSIYVFRVNSNDNENYLSPVWNANGHDSFVRSISWSSIEKDFFITSGNDGNVNVWDVRFCFQPVATLYSGRGYAPEVIWPLGVNAFLVCDNDGNIKQLESQDQCFTLVNEHPFAIWGMSMMSSHAALTYCSCDGIVGMQKIAENKMLKTRKPKQLFNVRLLEMSLADSPKQKQNESTSTSTSSASEKILQLRLPYHSSEKQNKKTSKKKKSKEKKVLPPDEIALHTVRFHPSMNPNLRNWLVVGGEAGLVVLLKVPESV